VLAQNASGPLKQWNSWGVLAYTITGSTLHVALEAAVKHPKMLMRNRSCSARSLEPELELIQTQMAQKPMLRAEVYARALRASSLARRRSRV
jgi:hypothetical protein